MLRLRLIAPVTARVHRVRTRAHEYLAAHHARHHATTAPANALMHESMSLLDHIGLIITNWVGTMICAIIFTILACISLPQTIASHDPVLIVQWIAQTFLQLVLLSIIMVGSNQQGRHSELRAETDHEINQRNADHLSKQDEHLLQQDEQILEILRRLETQRSSPTLVPVAPRPGRKRVSKKSQFDPNDPIEE